MEWLNKNGYPLEKNEKIVENNPLKKHYCSNNYFLYYKMGSFYTILKYITKRNIVTFKRLHYTI